MDLVSVDPQVAQLGIRLTELAARNTASTVSTRIRTAKATKQAQQVESELQEIINELQAQRAELFQIAGAFREQLAGQTISNADVSYITTQLLPKIKEFIDEMPLVDDDRAKAEQALKASGALVSTEALTVLQLLGFNFRRAIGEPLTNTVADAISSRTKRTSVSNEQIQLENMRMQRAYAELAQNEESYRRFRELFPGQAT